MDNPPPKKKAFPMKSILNHIETSWLVVDLPLWKIWKSVGMIIPNIWEKKKMFQTTNQLVFSIAMFDYERVVWHVINFLSFPGLCWGKPWLPPAISCWQSAWASSATLHHPTRRPELLNPEASSRWVSAHVHRKWQSVAGYGCFPWQKNSRSLLVS